MKPGYCFDDKFFIEITCTRRTKKNSLSDSRHYYDSGHNNLQQYALKYMAQQVERTSNKAKIPDLIIKVEAR